MQLIKVLIASLVATPALAHHEGSTASSVDATVITLLCATALFIIAASIKASVQSKKAAMKIRSSENEK